MDRRSFLQAGAAFSIAARGSSAALSEQPAQQWERAHDVRAIVPVVGDGKWIWTEPPEGETGYLEPRPYDLKIGIQLQGTGPAGQIRATTATPLNGDGQTVQSFQVHRRGCAAQVRALTRNAGQLMLAANQIARGQIISAVAHYRLTLRKDYRGFQKDQFPAEQDFPKAFRKRYLYDSPGIQTRFKLVKQTAAEVGQQYAHPWDRTVAFYKWVWNNIKAKVQPYTSVIAALKKRVGDCEERAATFVAFCRCSGIPARLVWVPNHNWAEFYLRDREGKGHWIPAHTSCYTWFGWTGAHELVLQKGDSVHVPEKRKPQRLLADWMQWQGARPEVRYLAELTPLPTESESDAGPGARRKDERGAWNRVGKHPLDPYGRDGARSKERPPSHLRSQKRAQK